MTLYYRGPLGFVGGKQPYATHDVGSAVASVVDPWDVIFSLEFGPSTTTTPWDLIFSLEFGPLTTPTSWDVVFSSEFGD